MAGRKKKSAEPKEEHPKHPEDLKRTFFNTLCGFEAEQVLIYCANDHREYISQIDMNPIQLLGVAERLRLRGASLVLQNDQKHREAVESDNNKRKQKRKKKTSNN